MCGGKVDSNWILKAYLLQYSACNPLHIDPLIAHTAEDILPTLE